MYNFWPIITYMIINLFWGLDCGIKMNYLFSEWDGLLSILFMLIASPIYGCTLIDC